MVNAGGHRLFNKEEVLQCWDRFNPTQRDDLLKVCYDEEREWIKEHDEWLRERAQQPSPSISGNWSRPGA